MLERTIPIPTATGEPMDTLVVGGESSKSPVVLVVQEIYGVNESMRRVATDLACEGYVVAVPDLFWRMDRNVSLDSSNAEDRKRAFSYLDRFDFDRGVDDLRRAVSHLRTLPECNGRVGAIGFCLGGYLTYLLATHGELDCGVGYYGGGIENALAKGAAISKPLLLHYGMDDEVIRPDVVARVEQALATNKNVTVHTYPGCKHAFARPGGKNFDAEAAALAMRRTLDLLASRLRDPA